MEKIIARNAGRVFETRQGQVVAFQNISLEIGEGEFVCLVGPSGCGKSTFLRVVAGLLDASSGEVRVHRTSNRQALSSMVFQEYALFPWKTALDNVAFGLEMRGVPRDRRYDIARRWLAKTGLARFTASYPHQLSGGMRQRVGIARAFASDPEILLMDEPLGALDAQTRIVLQEELLQLWEEERKTVLYVTHSLEEAVLLGDRVIVMTAQPGTIKMTVPVDLPRPRAIAMTGSPEFAALRQHIWLALQEEVIRTMEMSRR